MLRLDVSAIDRNLYLHIRSILEPNTALHLNYIHGLLKSEMLNCITGSSKSGLILTDHRYRPVYVNDKAAEIFQCSDKTDIRLRDYIGEQLLESGGAPESPLEILGNRYHYSRRAITLMDETIGYYIVLEDEADAENLPKNIYKKGLFAKYQFKDIVHRSDGMSEVIRTARQIALTDHTVLIRGESGTGKELIAQSIHNASYRSKYPFVAVNCAALPDSLLESELFGYEGGAFTGAVSKGQVGLFERANHGTIFLDEIGDISAKLQLRLLRAIQERQIMRIGSDKVVNIDVRFITATNRDLENAVSQGSFRGDLFYRLNVLPVVIPPLRERKSDIPALLSHFLGQEYQNITSQEQAALLNYDWPGNVRELENTATYFRTLSKLPRYILDQNLSGKNRKTFRADNIKTLLLHIICRNTAVSHGVGRPFLIQELGRQGYTVSDVKLRSLLKDLQSDEFIVINKGRGGTRITDKGREKLRQAEEK